MPSTEVSFIFDALDRSKITISDFSSLTKISRVTLYAWKNGSNITDRLRISLAYTTAVRINNACDKCSLPLVDKLKNPQRLALLRSIIRNSAS